MKYKDGFLYTNLKEIISFKEISDKIFTCRSNEVPSYKAVQTLCLDNSGDIKEYRIFDLTKDPFDIYDLYINKTSNIIAQCKLINKDGLIYYDKFKIYNDDYRSLISDNIINFWSSKDPVMNPITYELYNIPDKFFKTFYENEDFFNLYIELYCRHDYPWVYYNGSEILFPKLNKKLILKEPFLRHIYIDKIELINEN